VRRADGTLLNPKGTAIWRDGCPWRRAGVWDLDREGRPVLTQPDHFRVVDGRPVTAWADFMVPFIHRMREAVRRVHPDSFLFIEGAPAEFDTGWDDPDPLVCNARHWYDIMTLSQRDFDPSAFRALGGEVLSGVDAIAENFTGQLAVLKRISEERMGNPPILIGEIGTTFDMNDREAYRTGNYAKADAHVDAWHRALEGNLLCSTLWNYTPDNTHQLGDRWNREDLSIFSADDQTDPDDLDSGGRSTRQFCRPYVRHASGRPIRMSFDPDSGRFELELEADPDVTAPTVVHVPRLHYPRGPAAKASHGAVRHDDDRQVLEWDLGGASGRVTLSLGRGA
jgi:hypothetical protein